MDEIDFEHGGGTLLERQDYWVIRIALGAMGIDARSLRVEDVEEALLDDMFIRFSLNDQQRVWLYKEVAKGRAVNERERWKREYWKAVARSLREEE